MLRRKTWVFGDYINTDIIIPFRFKSRTNDPYELAKYAMYGIDPDFSKKVTKGDIIVAGKDFGGGSSREQAPVALKYAGIDTIIAESFARIFYRNCFSIGLPILEVPNITKHVKEGDQLVIDLEGFKVTNLTTNETYEAKHVTGYLLHLLRDRGFINYYKKHKAFPWSTTKK